MQKWFDSFVGRRCNDKFFKFYSQEVKIEEETELQQGPLVQIKHPECHVQNALPGRKRRGQGYPACDLPLWFI
jgi:hypothetical protein